MAKHETAPSIGQITEVISSIVQMLGKTLNTLTGDQLQWLIGHKKKVAKAIKEAIILVVPSVGSGDHLQWLSKWQRFYREVWGIDAAFSDLIIPTTYDDITSLLIMLEGMTPNRIFDKMHERFQEPEKGRHGAWKFIHNLDVITSPRTATTTYAVWHRGREAADEKHKNKSGNQCLEEGLNVLTTPERMMFDLFYHWEKGEHPDPRSSTLTSSRTCGGYVVGVSWDAHCGRVFVSTVHPDFALDCWRVREAVSA
jgi:hypothetical protein